MNCFTAVLRCKLLLTVIKYDTFYMHTLWKMTFLLL